MAGLYSIRLWRDSKCNRRKEQDQQMKLERIVKFKNNLVNANIALI